MQQRIQKYQKNYIQINRIYHMCHGSQTVPPHKAIDDLMELWEEGHTGDDAPLVPPMEGVVVPGVVFLPPMSFKFKSRAFPTLSNNPNIWAFVQQVTNEIDGFWQQTFQQSIKQSKRHRQAPKSLQHHSRLVVKPADKGGNVVVMYVEKYEIMCRHLLKHKEWYRPISKILVDNFIQEQYSMIFKAFQKGLLRNYIQD